MMFFMKHSGCQRITADKFSESVAAFGNECDAQTVSDDSVSIHVNDTIIMYPSRMGVSRILKVPLELGPWPREFLKLSRACPPISTEGM